MCIHTLHVHIIYIHIIYLYTHIHIHVYTHIRPYIYTAAGMGCTGDCRGRLVQEYTEAQLHIQIKYLESLFDLEKGLRNKYKAENRYVYVT